MSSYSLIESGGSNLPSTYVGLIYSRWMRSLRYGNDFFKLIKSDPFYEAYQKYIKTMLSNPSTIVRLAVLTDDKDVVLGFSVYHDKVLDYVHVHKDHRKLGVGSHLVPSYIDTISHITNTGLSIWGNKYPHWSFNPFA